MPCVVRGMKKKPRRTSLGASGKLSRQSSSSWRHGSLEFNIIKMIMGMQFAEYDGVKLHEVFKQLKSHECGPAQAAAWYRLAEVYQRADALSDSDEDKRKHFAGNNQKEAEDCFVKGYQHKCVDSEIKALCALQLGHICLCRDELQAAQQYLECAKEGQLENNLQAKILNELGIVYHTQSKVEKAKACWICIIKGPKTGTMPKAYHNFSCLFEQCSDYKNALDSLQRAKKHGYSYDEKEFKKRVNSLRSSMSNKMKARRSMSPRQLASIGSCSSLEESL